MNAPGSKCVLISGASGLIGRALAPALRTEGFRVVRLVRGPARGADEVSWEPASGRLVASEIEGVDAIVNLSGENVAGGRWTAERRERILSSRVDATRTLARAVSGMSRRPDAIVSASAIGIYGSRGNEILDETSQPGTGFLAEVCRAWEAEVARMSESGLRTVSVRLGVVLAREGGALKKLLPLFRCGLGGRVGSGRQWMSWITLRDAVGAIVHALKNRAVCGAINAVAPAPVTNAQFTKALASALSRPAVLPVPAVLLKLVFGQMAGETLLSSARVEPRELLQTGYAFDDPDLDKALAGLLRAAEKL